MTFTPAEQRALFDLTAYWHPRPFALIGARALSLGNIDMSWRQTEDLDLVVVAEVEEYPVGLDTLAGWRKDRRYEHRWHSPDGLRCDVLPAGPEVVRAGTLTWPSGHQITVTGLDLALVHHHAVTVGDVRVRVATPAVIMLLKMVAFLDRPGERERDLEDIAHTTDQYASDDERRWSIDLLAGRDWDEQSAWLLGFDLQKIAREEHRAIALRFLDQLLEAHPWWAGRMAQLAPVGWKRDPDVAIRRMAALREGLLAGVGA